MADSDESQGGGPRDDTAEAASDRETPSREEELKAALETARAEARQSHERWLRERADVENLKKRGLRERAETVKYANEQLLRDLLPIVDNLERAVTHAEGGGNGAPLVEGVNLVLKGLLDMLERHDVVRIAARGRPFDPAQHEAMAHIESTDHEPNSVIEEHQPGYRLHERLLRPALVTVAKVPGPRNAVAKDKGRG